MGKRRNERNESNPVVRKYSTNHQSIRHEGAGRMESPPTHGRDPPGIPPSDRNGKDRSRIGDPVRRSPQAHRDHPKGQTHHPEPLPHGHHQTFPFRHCSSHPPIPSRSSYGTGSGYLSGQVHPRSGNPRATDTAQVRTKKGHRTTKHRGKGILPKGMRDTIKALYQGLEDPHDLPDFRIPSKVERIAIVADIHGNIHALRAVLDDIAARNITTILNAGDSVGIGGDPQKVIKALRSPAIHSILGNFDLEVLKWGARKKQKKPRSLKQFSHDFTVSALKPKQFEFLASRPRMQRFRTRDGTILLTHAGTDSLNESIMFNSPVSRLRAMGEKAGTDIVITAHTHNPFQRTVGQVLFLNPGSVGRSGTSDTRACYAILTLQTRVVEFIRVPYPVQAAVSSLEEHGQSRVFMDMIELGLSLAEAQSLRREGEPPLSHPRTGPRSPIQISTSDPYTAWDDRQ